MVNDEAVAKKDELSNELAKTILKTLGDADIVKKLEDVNFRDITIEEMEKFGITEKEDIMKIGIARGTYIMWNVFARLMNEFHNLSIFDMSSTTYFITDRAAKVFGYNIRTEEDFYRYEEEIYNIIEVVTAELGELIENPDDFILTDEIITKIAKKYKLTKEKVIVVIGYFVGRMDMKVMNIDELYEFYQERLIPSLKEVSDEYRDDNFDNTGFI